MAMGSYLIRMGLTILIVGMAGFISFRVWTHMATHPPPTPEEASPARPADAWIKGFTYRQSEEGATKWKVQARRARVYDAEHRALLEDVTVHLFGKEETQMTVKAEEGLIDTETQNLNLQNTKEFIVVRFSNGYTIKSLHLEWVDASRRIQTQTPVVIQGNGITITGTGLVGNLEREEFRILHNVRAQVSL